MRAKLKNAVCGAARASFIFAIIASPSDVGAVDAKSCDRACLDAFSDRYVEALSAHDPSKLPLAPNVKFTENDQVLKLGEGAWKTNGRMGTYRIHAADPQSGQAGFIGALLYPGSDKATMYALRMKIVDGQIAEIETIVPYNSAIGVSTEFETATAKLTTARAAFARPLTAKERVPRAVMIAAATSYYTGIEAGHGDVVAFGDDCQRIENGIPLVNNPSFVYPFESPDGRPLPNFAAMGCREQFDTHIWETDSVEFVRVPLVDEERGTVFVFSQYHVHSKKPCANVVNFGPVCGPKGAKPFSLAMLEAHRIANGLIHEQESVWVVIPSNQLRSPWAEP
jgi:hypothetical protein